MKRNITFREYRKEDKQYLEDIIRKTWEKDRNVEYNGEIAFFAVSEECRGTGIGKSLFNMALDYFKEEEVKSFYLYTDSSCNYGFYEHKGLVRCGEKAYKLPGGFKKEMKFYLYEGYIL